MKDGTPLGTPHTHTSPIPGYRPSPPPPDDPDDPYGGGSADCFYESIGDAPPRQEEDAEAFKQLAGDRPDDFWDAFVEREYARAAGELDVFGMADWSDAHDSIKSQAVQDAQARRGGTHTETFLTCSASAHRVRHRVVRSQSMDRAETQQVTICFVQIARCGTIGTRAARCPGLACMHRSSNR